MLQVHHRHHKHTLTDTLLALEHHGPHSLHSLLAPSMRASSYKATCVLFWWLCGGDFTRSQTGAGAAGQWEARARRLRPISCSQSAAGRVIEACCSRDRRLIVTSPRPLRQLRHRYWSATSPPCSPAPAAAAVADKGTRPSPRFARPHVFQLFLNGFIVQKQYWYVKYFSARHLEVAWIIKKEHNFKTYKKSQIIKNKFLFKRQFLSFIRIIFHM